MSAPDAVGAYAPGRRIPLGAIIGPLRHGGGDPTWRRDDTGIQLGLLTPHGPVGLHLRLRPGSQADEVHARAWGPGATWSVDHLGDLLGERDDPSGFRPEHPVLQRLHREHAAYRVPRSGLVMATLVPVVIEQRVTGRQAFAAYRALVRAFGARAPGPLGGDGLMVPPTVAAWRRVPSWTWLRAGVDAQRADTVARALSVAARLEECVDLTADQARARLTAVPGIGLWTANEVAQRALGDADALSVGDYHVAKDVTYALEGRVGDDARMVELLEPYAGHRFRVQRLLEHGRVRRPRRGARLTLPTHLPVGGVGRGR